MENFDVVIVGGGHAGAQSATALRQSKFTGKILIISNESDLPYERPPLSKEYLAEEKSFERLLIRPAEYWIKNDIKFLLNEEAVSVDPRENLIVTNKGTKIQYENLIWAAGGVPRKPAIKGTDLEGVHVVRSRADVDGIKKDCLKFRTS